MLDCGEVWQQMQAPGEAIICRWLPLPTPSRCVLTTHLSSTVLAELLPQVLSRTLLVDDGPRQTKTQVLSCNVSIYKRGRLDTCDLDF